MIQWHRFTPSVLSTRSGAEQKENGASGRELRIWLPSLDTFRTFAANLRCNRTRERLTLS